MTKKFLSAFLCMFLVCVPCIALQTQPKANAVLTLTGISAPSAILVHESGAVLFEQDAHTARPPASVTKIMTLLLVLEALDSGQISLSNVVTASAHACSMGGSQIWLKEGEQFTVDELLKCITVASANDCAVALGEYLCGTEDAFVARMNQRALELGMNDTHFINASGLHDEGHVTSAYDISLMSRELIKHTQIFNYTKIWQDTIRDGAFTLTNTNKMIRTYDGMTGLKTGSTSQAKYCLSATATRDGLTLIAVVMGCSNSNVRTADVTAMLNYGFATYSAVQISSDIPILPIEVILGKEKYSVCELADTTPVLIQKSLIPFMEKKIEMPETLQAPVAKGQQVGTLTVTAQGETIATIPIVSKIQVDRLGFWDIFLKLMRCASMRGEN